MAALVNRFNAAVAWFGGHRNARRALGVAATVLLAAAGTIGLIAFFVAHDTAQVSSGNSITGTEYPSLGNRHLRPGTHTRVRYNTYPPTSGPHVVAPVKRDQTYLTDDQILTALEQGNVVVVYGTRQPPGDLAALAMDEAGPFDPSLARAGQAVILARRRLTHIAPIRHLRPRKRRDAVVGLAWRHRALFLSAQGGGYLRSFVRYWLEH